MTTYGLSGRAPFLVPVVFNESKPVAEAERTSYENIETTCPHCHRRNVLNRASDLRTFMPVAGKAVPCTECGKQFWLVGDSVSDGYESMLYDSTFLLKRKRFMLAVAGACQAYEMFFALYLRVELVYKPFWRDRKNGLGPSVTELNDLDAALRSEVGGFSFDRMRACFLRQAVTDTAPRSVREAASAIQALGRSGHRRSARLSVIRRAPLEKRVKELLRGVARTKVNELRNKVVHQRGYRPRQGEAEIAVKEARSLLFPLGYDLDLHEDINWYAKNLLSPATGRVSRAAPSRRTTPTGPVPTRS